MSAYDDVIVGERRGQVKLWDCGLNTYGVGDRVPAIDEIGAYSVKMREGGFVNVFNDKIQSWTDEPMVSTVYDKWGDEVRFGSVGLLGEPYAFDE